MIFRGPESKKQNTTQSHTSHMAVVRATFPKYVRCSKLNLKQEIFFTSTVTRSNCSHTNVQYMQRASVQTIELRPSIPITVSVTNEE